MRNVLQQRGSPSLSQAEPEEASPVGADELTGPVTRPRPRRRLPAWEAIASVVLVGVILELLGRVGVLSRSSFPLVSEVLRRLGRDGLTGTFWIQTWHTLAQAITGLVLAAVLAIPTGLLLGRVRLLDQALQPIVEFLRPIPSIAILPLVILAVGIGFTGAVLLATISCFWLILVMTIRGARSVDPVARQAMTVFGLPRRAQAWRLILPSATPFIVTGIRISASVSLIVVITAELLGGMPGLGKAVAASLQAGDRTGMYAYIVAAGLLGLVLNTAIRPLERRVLRWHPSMRKEGRV